MLEHIFKNLPAIEEGNFRYYEVDKYFDVSINTIDPNTEIPFHVHDQDVHNYVFSGSITFTTEETEERLEKGEWIYIPAGRRHAVKTTEAVCLLEFWKKKMK